MLVDTLIRGRQTTHEVDVSGVSPTEKKPNHRLNSVPVREIPGVELYLKQKLKLNMHKNILLVKLKAAFNIYH